MEPGYLTSTQLARLTGVPARTIRFWLQRRQIPAIRRGRRGCCPCWRHAGRFGGWSGPGRFWLLGGNALANCVEKPLRLARVVARLTKHVRELEFEDRVQEAWFGLHAAERLFDPSKGLSFLSFAIQKGRYAILDAAERARRGPKQIATDPYELAGAGLTEEGRHTGHELAEHEGLVQEPDLVGDLSDRDQVARLLAVLPPKLRTVIMQRYGLGGERPKTCQEIAEPQGLTRQAVSLRELQALEKLREAAGVSR